MPASNPVSWNSLRAIPSTWICQRKPTISTRVKLSEVFFLLWGKSFQNSDTVTFVAKEGVGGRPQHQSKARCEVKIPPRPSRSEAFPPSRNWRDIKAKQFSIPFKRKRVARKIKELKRKLFCFARRVSAGGNAGVGFQIIRAIFARKRFELRSAIATKLNILKVY